MTIRHWPSQDRPREKLLLQGENSLTDAELIAIFLNTGSRGKTALDLARELLQEYGGLSQLARIPRHILTSRHGFGDAKYASLKAAIELGRRYQQTPLRAGQTLDSSVITRAYLKARLQSHTKEVFACLFMDTHYRLIAFEELFQGTVNQASIYPREIVKRCLQLNATHVILAHNHPSGLETPSQADKDVTNVIVKALALVDIRVVDHIVIGNPASFSFADAGLL